jgi:hypothetical protein
MFLVCTKQQLRNRIAATALLAAARAEASRPISDQPHGG